MVKPKASMESYIHSIYNWQVTTFIFCFSITLISIATLVVVSRACIEATNEVEALKKIIKKKEAYYLGMLDEKIQGISDTIGDQINETIIALMAYLTKRSEPATMAEKVLKTYIKKNIKKDP